LDGHAALGGLTPAKGRRRVAAMHKKGGKHHIIPFHHSLAEALRGYIDAGGIAEERKGFCSTRHAVTRRRHFPSCASACEIPNAAEQYQVVFRNSQ
jgi:hypothetical protein